MINIGKELHRHYFCKAFFQYKILEDFVKLNVGLFAQIKLTLKELA